MHWKISVNPPIEGDDEVVRLRVGYGLRGRVCVSEKGTNAVDGLATRDLDAETVNDSTWPFVPRQSFNLGGDPAPADVDYFCVNKPIYDCPEKVDRAGAKCSLCKNLKRPVGGTLALHHDSFCAHDGTQTFKEDAEHDSGDPQVLAH
ncbi:hypothetical protein HO133_007000 [Letharia lupina]|uniref:Uncharacterized protein n=1 Tax=Letharia lupina TaxID=560253 RepID=A0A8H6FI14_9LECA|nr:uncharacterized protein HO133_007000 [Letharia lupina]KAF6228888.1 hypothetical protein HO133_007000 [Letharia lupina]